MITSDCNLAFKKIYLGICQSARNSSACSIFNHVNNCSAMFVRNYLLKTPLHMTCQDWFHHRSGTRFVESLTWYDTDHADSLIWLDFHSRRTWWNRPMYLGLACHESVCGKCDCNITNNSPPCGCMIAMTLRSKVSWGSSNFYCVRLRVKNFFFTFCQYFLSRLSLCSSLWEGNMVTAGVQVNPATHRDKSVNASTLHVHVMM